MRIGGTLWVTYDETISLELLTLNPAGDAGGKHRQFSLADYFCLPAPLADSKAVEEADVDGLAYADGYLWLVGSHSLRCLAQWVVHHALVKSLQFHWIPASIMLMGKRDTIGEKPCRSNPCGRTLCGVWRLVAAGPEYGDDAVLQNAKIA